MTPKELLYIEDALGHERYFAARCRETASKLQDASLRTYVEQMGETHTQLFNGFLNLL